MKRIWIVALLVFAFAGSTAFAQSNLDISTPAIAAIRDAMHVRHSSLAPFYESGAVGLTDDGKVALRDASSVPLAQRRQLNQLITAENSDRSALYRELARANGHPEWEPQVQETFAKRWVDKAKAGWWVQTAGGAWSRK